MAAMETKYLFNTYKYLFKYLISIDRKENYGILKLIGVYKRVSQDSKILLLQFLYIF